MQYYSVSLSVLAKIIKINGTVKTFVSSIASRSEPKGSDFYLHEVIWGDHVKSLSKIGFLQLVYEIDLLGWVRISIPKKKLIRQTVQIQLSSAVENVRVLSLTPAVNWVFGGNQDKCRKTVDKYGIRFF